MRTVPKFPLGYGPTHKIDCKANGEIIFRVMRFLRLKNFKMIFTGGK